MRQQFLSPAGDCYPFFQENLKAQGDSEKTLKSREIRRAHTVHVLQRACDKRVTQRIVDTCKVFTVATDKQLCRKGQMTVFNHPSLQAQLTVT